MSKEMKKGNEGSWMSSFLKSTVGKMAILASTAAAMSSCTTTTYSNSTGFSERIESRGMSAGQVLQGAAIIGGIATDNHAISSGSWWGNSYFSGYNGGYQGGYHGGHHGSHSGCGYIPGVRYAPNKGPYGR